MFLSSKFAALVSMKGQLAGWLHALQARQQASCTDRSKGRMRCLTDGAAETAYDPLYSASCHQRTAHFALICHELHVAFWVHRHAPMPREHSRAHEIPKGGAARTGSQILHHAS